MQYCTRFHRASIGICLCILPLRLFSFYHSCLWLSCILPHTSYIVHLTSYIFECLRFSHNGLGLGFALYPIPSNPIRPNLRRMATGLWCWQASRPEPLSASLLPYNMRAARRQWIPWSGPWTSLSAPGGSGAAMGFGTNMKAARR